jgi:regulator of sirC expression with transglutaminase-like and TPR domain
MDRVTREPAWTTDFERLGHMPDEDIDLAVAALFIAQAEYPDLEGESELEALDGMAAVVRQRIEDDGDEGALHRMNIISTWLADDLRFSGNHDNYYDARNSYINDVLDRHSGIPISLALIYIEVGRRAGVPLVGIGLPGHFLVGHSGIDDHYMDPFHGGTLISREEAKALFTRMMADAPVSGPSKGRGGGQGRGEIKWDDAYLTPVTNRDFVTRMLRNLKGIHLRFQDFDRAVRVMDMLVAMHPTSPEERRDRGLVHFKLGNRAQALSDLKVFAESQAPGLGDTTISNIINRLGS